MFHHRVLPVRPVPGVCLSLAFCLAAPTLLGAQSVPCYAEFDSNTNVVASVTPPSFGPPITYAFPLSLPKTMAVEGARIFTGNSFASGSMALAIFSDDAARQAPKQEIVSGTWFHAKSSSKSWQGSNFSRPVVLEAFTTYWIVWTPVGLSQLPSEGANGPNGRPCMVGAVGSPVWTRAPQTQQFKIRLFCAALDHRGVEIFGQGCPDGTGVIGSCFTNDSPTLGNSAFRLQATNLPIGSRALLLVGVRRKFTSLDLGIAGAPGCFLHVDAGVAVAVADTVGKATAGTVAPAAGLLSTALPIPNDPRLKGAFLRAQYLAVDANALRPLDVVSTNGLGITVQ